MVSHGNRYGSIKMVTEFPFYEPGNTVSGTIFLRATLPITGIKCIKLEIIGGYKCSFVLASSYAYRGEKEIEMILDQGKLFKNKKFFHYAEKVPCFSSSELAPGDYSIRFSFNLPDGLPSSFIWKEQTLK